MDARADSETVPFDVDAVQMTLGAHRLVVWRPSHPQDVDDPHAERGAAGPVWAHAWMSGEVLAQLVAQSDLNGVRVLELGCGLGIVGLAAAAAGARVTVSDRSPYALAFAAVNAEANDLPVEAVRCDWADPAPLEARGPWDLVLGADVLYDERGAHDLLSVLGRVTSPGGEVWLTDPGRAPAHGFLAAAWVDWDCAEGACGAGVRLHRLTPAGATAR